MKQKNGGNHVMAERFERKWMGLMVSIWVMAFVSSVTIAGDWQALRDLKAEALSVQIYEFQKRLDQNSSDYKAIKGLGIAYHIKAKEDAKKFAPKAVDMLNRARQINKRDYEALCYLGSAMTMMAKTTWNPIKKMSYANKGIALMDKAVKRAPDNISVRMTRAYNSIALPSFFEREGIAVEDFEHLSEMIERDPVSFLIIKKEVYSNLAKLYRKNGEEDKAEKCMKLAIGS